MRQRSSAEVSQLLFPLIGNLLSENESACRQEAAAFIGDLLDDFLQQTRSSQAGRGGGVPLRGRDDIAEGSNLFAEGEPGLEDALSTSASGADLVEGAASVSGFATANSPPKKGLMTDGLRTDANGLSAPPDQKVVEAVWDLWSGVSAQGDLGSRMGAMDLALVIFEKCALSNWRWPVSEKRLRQFEDLARDQSICLRILAANGVVRFCHLELRQLAATETCLQPPDPLSNPHTSTTGRKSASYRGTLQTMEKIITSFWHDVANEQLQIIVAAGLAPLIILKAALNDEYRPADRPELPTAEGVQALAQAGSPLPSPPTPPQPQTQAEAQVPASDSVSSSSLNAVAVDSRGNATKATPPSLAKGSGSGSGSASGSTPGSGSGSGIDARDLQFIFRGSSAHARVNMLAALGDCLRVSIQLGGPGTGPSGAIHRALVEWMRAAFEDPIAEVGMAAIESVYSVVAALPAPLVEAEIVPALAAATQRPLARIPIALTLPAVACAIPPPSTERELVPLALSLLADDSREVRSAAVRSFLQIVRTLVPAAPSSNDEIHIVRAAEKVLFDAMNDRQWRIRYAVLLEFPLFIPLLSQPAQTSLFTKGLTDQTFAARFVTASSFLHPHVANDVPTLRALGEPLLSLLDQAFPKSPSTSPLNPTSSGNEALDRGGSAVPSLSAEAPGRVATGTARCLKEREANSPKSFVYRVTLIQASLALLFSLLFRRATVEGPPVGNFSPDEKYVDEKSMNDINTAEPAKFDKELSSQQDLGYTEDTSVSRAPMEDESSDILEDRRAFAAEVLDELVMIYSQMKVVNLRMIFFKAFADLLENCWQSPATGHIAFPQFLSSEEPILSDSWTLTRGLECHVNGASDADEEKKEQAETGAESLSQKSHPWACRLRDESEKGISSAQNLFRRIETLTARSASLTESSPNYNVGVRQQARRLLEALKYMNLRTE